MRRTSYVVVVSFVLLFSFREAFAKGCGGTEVILKENTELTSEIGKIPVQAGKVTICWPYFGKPEPTEAELKEKGFLHRGAVLSKGIKLAGIPLEKGTQLEFPDPFAHGDADFYIVTNRVFHFGKISLVGSQNLKIEIDAFEPVDVVEGRRTFLPRKDGTASIKGIPSENVTLNGLLTTAAQPIKFEGKVDDILKGNSDRLTLLLGTIITGTLKTPQGEIRFDNGDTMSLLDAKVRAAIKKNGGTIYLDVYTKNTRYIFPTQIEKGDSTRYEATERLSFNWETGALEFFMSGTDFVANGMQIARGTHPDHAIGIYPKTNRVQYATPKMDQTVQGIPVIAGWNKVYFWESGKIMHAPEVTATNFTTLTVNGKKVTAPRASLSFNPKGELKFVYMSQAKYEGETTEFNGYFEMKEGKAILLPKDSVAVKEYNWNYVTDAFKKWLAQ